MSDDISNAIDWVGCTTTGPHHAHEIRMKAHKALASLRAEIEKLRAALKFYDDDDNWRLNGPLDTNSGNFTAGPAKEVLGE